MAMSLPSPTKTWHNAVYDKIDPKRPELSAKGKNVLVTGGGIGIGISIARAFAEAGASVVGILGRTESALKETKKKIESEFPSARVTVLVGDVASESSVQKALASFKDSHGLIDVFVHNAGYMSDLLTATDSPVDEWFKSFEVNVKGAFVVTKAFLGVAAKDAVLIAVGTGAMSLLVPNSSAYLTSKFAASRFFEYVQVENPNIRVHNIHPGGIETSMAVKTRAAGMNVPMDDFSLPGAFAVWTASPEAAFTKGKFMWSNWDVTELKAQEAKITGTPYLGLGLNGWPFME